MKTATTQISKNRKIDAENIKDNLKNAKYGKWTHTTGTDFVNRLLMVARLQSQKSLAENLGVDDRTISQWKNGKATPNADTLLYIAGKYNCSVDYLLGIDNKKENRRNDERQRTLADIAAPLLDMLEDDDCFIFDVDAEKKTCKNFDGTAGSGIALGFYNETLDRFHTSYVQKFLQEFSDIWHIRNTASTGRKIYERWKSDILAEYSQRVKYWRIDDALSVFRADWQFMTKYEIAETIIDKIIISSSHLSDSNFDYDKWEWVNDSEIDFLLSLNADDGGAPDELGDLFELDIKAFCADYKKERDAAFEKYDDPELPFR